MRLTKLNISTLALVTATGLSAFAAGLIAQTGKVGDLRPALMFVSSRDHLESKTISDLFLALEIYISDPDGSKPRRLTHNRVSDCYPKLSPDGTRIVFDSGRLRSKNDPDNLSDIFIMNADGSNQTHLVRGSSATWSPDGKYIAYHASASGKGKFNHIFPGAATSDSDIFILNVDEFLKGKAKPRNLTNNSRTVDEDADWSPDGKTIVYTRHGVDEDHENAVTAEIYRSDAGGSGLRVRLTVNGDEERSPSWSPDGRQISFVCKNGTPVFQICVMKADGTGKRAITTKSGLTHTWMPDGRRIIFHRSMGEAAVGDEFQLFSIDVDGANERQLTTRPGLNGFPSLGVVRTDSLMRNGKR